MTDPQLQQQAWTPRPLAPVHTSTYDPPKQQTHHASSPRFPAFTNHASHQPTGSIVYADLSIARATPLQPNQNEMSPTEYAVLQFMSGGQEVQPFKPILSDLVYADVDDKDYGPTYYKKASILQASEKKAQAQGLPVRPTRETRL
ncbi:hypothetical protein DAPPUDRAFT_336451 [Daphnia pulex]|nr:hypothetical protein DAPPUDRAFT_336451 [Daphnia pulex]|eukprot:EFX62771.1 hypothetical protein DAPPUDRAFT_336451 [Daphnia pulex]